MKQQPSIPAAKRRDITFHPIGERSIDYFGIQRTMSGIPVHHAGEHIVLPPVSPCRHSRHLTIFIFDESGSVTAHNDPSRPIAARHLEAELAIDRLGTCRCGSEIAAVLFFPPSAVVAGPHPLNRRGQRALLDAIAQRPMSTSSCLDDALEAAQALVDAHPDHDATLVVLSDFELFDPDPEATLARFSAFPADRHAVVLQGDVPEALELDPDVHVTHVTWDAQRGAVARAVVAAMSASRSAV